MQLECVFYFPSRLVLLYDHLELGILEASLVFAAILLKEGVIDPTGAFLGATLSKFQAVFGVIEGVTLPAGHTFPPRGYLETAPAADTAIAALWFLMTDVVEVLLDVELFILVVILEMQQC